jgi:imidazolonepropionase-like amidohydrolase
MKLLRAGTVLPGPRGERVDDGAVVIDGTTIAFAGPVSELPRDLSDGVDDATEFGADVTLMPGLIDSHVHLGFDGGPGPVARMRSESDAEQLVLMLRSARELLSVGVTTARDLGARAFLDIVVRDAIAAGMARGPRLVTAGPPLTVTGGHCWFMGGECDDVEGVRHRVRLHHKAGVDLIKVMSTGGFMTHGSAPWFAQFTEEQLAAAVDEAHRVGKRVAAHAHGVEGIRRALGARVDTLEHCSFVRPDGTNTIDDDLVTKIAETSTYVCPTTNHRLPEMLAVRGDGWQPAVRTLYERGAKIIAGTDAGIDHVPHHAYVGGLEALVLLGIPEDEVLCAATVRAAEALAVGHITGRLAAGWEADVIAVGGDPLQDISVLNDLRLVMGRGEPFVPDRVERTAPDPATAQERAAQFQRAMASAPEARATA